MNPYRRLISTAAIVVCMSFAEAGITAEQAKSPGPTGRQQVIFQVSDADPGKWNLALNNAKNVQEDLGAANVDIEVVAYGPGIGMIKLESAVGNRVKDAMAAGVRVVACVNTMTNMKLTKYDMLPSLLYVPAGVVELMQRQREGYAYIRP